MSASQGSSGSGPPPSSQGKEEKEWKLKGCDMEIGGIGKKDPKKDEFMTIDLIFRFEDIPTPRVVGE